MQDLKADKEYCERSIEKGRLNNTQVWDFVGKAIYGWPEAIERAIKAENAVAILTETVDIQRASIQQLSAQVAGSRNALGWIRNNSDTGFMYMGQLCGKGVGDSIKEKCDSVLSQPDPGAKIMAVVEAAKKVLAWDKPGEFLTVALRVKEALELEKALTDLEEGRP